MTEQGHLRIGTADRAQALSRLQLAATEGRLTAAEASERIAALDVALTYNDLDALLHDLPPIRPAVQPLAPRGWSPDNRLLISAGMSSEKRQGPWEIPAYLRVSAEFGSVKLDCREAVCLSPVVDIDVHAGAGSVKLIVPEGWGVDSDLVAKGMGGVRNRAQPRPEPGMPQLVLHGTAAVGSVRVRTARHRNGRRLRRQLQAQQQPAIGWVEQHPEMPNADDLR